MTPRKEPFENIVGKGENAGYLHLLSKNVFYPIKDRNHHFSNLEFVTCKFGPVQKFVVW